MARWLALCWVFVVECTIPSLVRCNSLVLQFLHKSSVENRALATNCLQQFGEEIQVCLTDVLPSLVLQKHELSRSHCTSRFQQVIEVLRSHSPFYHQVSFNFTLTIGVAKALNGVASVVAQYLNTYTCLPFVDLNHIANAADRTYYKFFREFPSDTNMVGNKEEHFLYLMRSIEDMQGVRRKLDDEDGDPQVLLTENQQETIELDEIRRNKYVELSDEEFEQQTLFEAFHRFEGTCSE